VEFRFKDYLLAPGAILKARQRMASWPARPRAEVEPLLLAELKRICQHARTHVPFYRKWFEDCGCDPDRMDTFDHWRKLPALDKQLVRQNLDRMRSNNADSLGAVWCQTSGSTGTAMRFLLDRSVNAAAFALFWRAWSLAPGWFPGRLQATLSGYAKGQWSYQPKTRILALSSFHLSPAVAREFHKLLLQYRPVFLRGYPSSLYLFGKLLEESKLELEFPVIFSGAETLLPYQREFIESFFKARVIDHYTHWERTASIRQCSHGRLHAEDDFGFHEIVLEDGTPAPPGKPGRLICTSLYNLAMPLIRYDTRDVAVWSGESSCPCGSQFPIVERIEGRIEDVIVTPEGRRVGRLDAAFKYSPNILLAQIVQDSVQQIAVSVVCGPTYNEREDEKPLLRELRARLGEQIRIDLKKVDDLPRTPMGKLRFVVSRLPATEKYGHH
jgi:phenylacetate-CoA ligase